jgi:hypothetical protein
MSNTADVLSETGTAYSSRAPGFVHCCFGLVHLPHPSCFDVVHIFVFCVVHFILFLDFIMCLVPTGACVSGLSILYHVNFPLFFSLTLQTDGDGCFICFFPSVHIYVILP